MKSFADFHRAPYVVISNQFRRLVSNEGSEGEVKKERKILMDSMLMVRVLDGECSRRIPKTISLAKVRK